VQKDFGVGRGFEDIGFTVEFAGDLAVGQDLADLGGGGLGEELGCEMGEIGELNDSFLKINIGNSCL